MSGGHFDYIQSHIIRIKEEIEQVILNNGIEPSQDNKSWYFGESIPGYNFSPETIEEFKKAVEILGQAYVYASRIDWLLSGDDSEDSFKTRLEKDLKKLNT